MPTFQDSQGQTWSPRVTVRVDRKFADAFGSTLAEEITRNKNENLTTSRLYDLLWFSVESEAVARSVDRDAFLDRLGSLDVAEKALAAVWQSTLDYFPERVGNPLKRLFQKTLVAAEQAHKKASDALNERVDHLSGEDVLLNSKALSE